MKTIHLGEFHNVVGAQMTPRGLCLWDTTDMEYFIELISAEPLTASGEFGKPPEDGGFQHVEGLRIHSVERVDIRSHRLQLENDQDYEVRELHIRAQQGADLKWDLYIPKGAR